MTKILVIDDSQELLDDIIETLGIEDYEAQGATSGQEGIRLAHEIRPDLIVCDIMMPGMDGYEVLRSLRSDPSTAVIPFIFLTALTSRSDRRQGMSLGADDFVTKPFAVDELLSSIETQIRKRKELNDLAEEHLAELRNTIVTALPHELYTPLNTIIGFADMLQLEADTIKPDQIISWSQLIRDAADRLLRLNENFLYYARLRLALTAPDSAESFGKSYVEFPDLVVSEAVRSQVARANRLNDLQIDLADVSRIKCSSENFNKVIAELISNALKFSETGQIIKVSSRIEDNKYLLQVHDGGRGMEGNIAERIGLYRQFDRSLYEQQGMGMGLAIVQSIMQLCDGRLSIETHPGEGFTVCLTFEILAD
ncbi:MAG: hybrid sensor histidine kinase/response regulator [Anaerolineaceae bacterium]|nr:hybrid sensor histidine kinase/response regulator [Anaerolineaceae bacterium]